MEIFYRVFIKRTDPHPQAQEIEEESEVEAPDPYTIDKHIAVMEWLDKLTEWGSYPVCRASK